MGLIDIDGLFDSAFGLVGKFVEDKDKRNELNMKLMELKNSFKETLLRTKTTPRVDAIVKLLLALNALWRPAVSAGMLVFFVYAKVTGIELPENVQLLLAGSFPAWGVSRHLEKKRK